MTSFKTICDDLAKLLERKQAAYGDSVGVSEDFLRLLYPTGIRPEQYGDLQLQVRVFDKLKRIATSKTAFGENPWRDVAGYAVLAVAQAQEQEQPREPTPALPARYDNGVAIDQPLTPGNGKPSAPERIAPEPHVSRPYGDVGGLCMNCGKRYIEPPCSARVHQTQFNKIKEGCQ